MDLAATNAHGPDPKQDLIVREVEGPGQLTQLNRTGFERVMHNSRHGAFGHCEILGIEVPTSKFRVSGLGWRVAQLRHDFPEQTLEIVFR